MRRCSAAESPPTPRVYDPYQAVFQQTLSSPGLEAFMRGSNLVVRVHLPGLRAERLVVRLDDGVLSIWDENPQTLGNDWNCVWHENGAEPGFVRRLTLPSEIRQQDIATMVRNGALEVSLSLGHRTDRSRPVLEVNTQYSPVAG
jgi:HSP20 family molecular chaperone IbpA